MYIQLASNITPTPGLHRAIGGTLSLTLIVCLQVDELPQASTTVHVRIIVASHGNTPEIISEWENVSVPGQLSVAVAVPVTEGIVSFVQVTVAVGGQTITGSTVSMVWMPIVQVLLLLHKSVTVSVTVVSPQPVILLGLTLRDWIWQLSVEPPSTKAGVTVYIQLASNITPTPGLQTAIGGTLSLTIIDWTQVDELPQASVAVHVRLIVPSQGKLPDTTSEWVKVITPGQLSVAVAVPVTEGMVSVVHVTVAVGGHVIIGGTVSIVWIPIVQVLMLPHQSVTVKVTVVLPQPVIRLGLTVMDWILQLSVEPLSTNAGVTRYWQLASKITPTPGLHRAIGGTLSLTTTVWQMVELQPFPVMVKQTV